MARLFLRIWVLVLLAWVTPALAQTVPAGPLMGSEASPSDAATTPELPATAYRVLVVGDGLAGGLGAGMTRMTEESGDIEIINRFNESSGLARREVYDWPSAIAKILSDRPVDAVVVLVGMNDRQDIRSGNFRYPFRSPDWVKGYEANIDQLLAAAKAASAQVFWVSIPPMADVSFDADMRYLSDIHAKRVTAGGGTYVDVRAAFLDATGQYVDRGPDETGVDRKLRSRDGITFFKQGNNRFGQLVLAEIAKRNTATTGGPGAAAVPVVISNEATAKVTIPAAPETPVVTGVPGFGQEGLDGEQITFMADAVKPAAQSRPVQPAAAAVTTVDIRLTAKPGTAAARLFSTGEIAAAPAGRFDDFAAPAQQ